MIIKLILILFFIYILNIFFFKTKYLNSNHPTCQPFNFDDVFGDYLEEVLGAVKHKPKRKANGKTYEVRRFPASKDKSYIIKTTTHVTTIVGGVHLDSWNCGEWRANTYWEIDKELL